MDGSRWGRHASLLGASAIAVVLFVGGPAWADPGGDPHGNNGTMKVDTYPPGSGMDNDPHVGCSFTLRFFGFDADQHSNITFVAQAPSGSGQVVHADHNVLISDDPAAGGPNDEDATIPYHVLGTTGPGAAIDLSGLTASNQGYHLKVMSDSVEAPGGAKQKVFWVDCAPTGAPTGASPVMPSASSAELSALLAASSESIVRSLLGLGGSSVGASSAAASTPTASAPPGVVVAVPTPTAAAATPAVARGPGSDIHGEHFARSTTRTGGSEQTLAFTGFAAAAATALGALLIAAGLVLGRVAVRPSAGGR